MSTRSLSELEGGLDLIRSSPRDSGTLDLIVRRPAVDARETLDAVQLDLREGLVGDNWTSRRSRRTADGSPHPDTQLTIMSTRVVDLVAGSRERWPLAGDQLYVDLDLGEENLPAGTRLRIGDALLEVTSQLHTGCAKFAERFGADALRFVSTPHGRALRLRGLYAKVIEPGAVRVGDVVEKR